MLIRATTEEFMSLSQDELEDTLFLDLKQIRDRNLDIADYAGLLRLCGIMKKNLPDAEQRGSFFYLPFAAKLQRAERLWYIESQKTGLPYIDKGFFRMYSDEKRALDALQDLGCTEASVSSFAKPDLQEELDDLIYRKGFRFAKFNDEIELSLAEFLPPSDTRSLRNPAVEFGFAYLKQLSGDPKYEHLLPALYGRIADAVMRSSLIVPVEKKPDGSLAYARIASESGKYLYIVFTSTDKFLDYQKDIRTPFTRFVHNYDLLSELVKNSEDAFGLIINPSTDSFIADSAFFSYIDAEISKTNYYNPTSWIKVKPVYKLVNPDEKTSEVLNKFLDDMVDVDHAWVRSREQLGHHVLEVVIEFFKNADHSGDFEEWSAVLHPLLKAEKVEFLDISDAPDVKSSAPFYEA